MNKFWAVIVIYNKACDESISCKGLVEQLYNNVLIVDNSTNDFDNKKFCDVHGWTYISMNGNAGIAKAYNRAIDYLKDKALGVIWLDDDTKLEKEYFIKLENLVNNNPDVSVFLPVVTSEVGNSSPCRIKNFNVSPVQNINSLTYENLTGINAGMAVRMSAYSNFRYDERYMLDYIDHNFIIAMKKSNRKIKIIDCRLSQNFSGRSDNYNSSVTRLKIFKRDFNLFCKDNAAPFWLYPYTILRRKLFLCLKFRTASFLFI